jgi:hypothetical protein
MSLLARFGRKEWEHKFELAFRSIDNLLERGGCTTKLDYTEETFWRLFLKYLTTLRSTSTEAALHGKHYAYILDKPCR